MRAKPYITCGLLAGALTLPVSAFALGLGKLTVQSGLGQPLSATIELTSAQKDELDTLRARIADPAVYRDNNVAISGSDVARAHRRRADCERRALPASNDVAGGQRRLPRSVGRAELGDGARRARLHVPARSAEQHRNTGGRARCADPGPGRGRSGGPRSSRFRWRRRSRRAPFGRRCSRRGCICRRADLYGQARRHAVEDRPANTNPRTSASSRCWSRCSAATRTPSTTAT